LDDIDRRLLRLVQQGLPLVARPFLALANQVEISEAEVISRLEKLKGSGQLRRMGGVFDSRHLGYVSALCALKTEPEEADALAATINSYPGVTHNYLRDNPRLNLWFTLTCASEDEFNSTIADLTAKTKRQIHCYPARRRYKIKFYLPLETTNDLK